MHDLKRDPPIAIARGEGVWLIDHDGKRYLDAISSWWVNLFGHGHPTIKAAIAAQLDQLEHVMLAGFTHRPAIELAEALVAVAPAGLSRVFYTDNGASAVEVALKMSFHYWRNLGQPAKQRFVALTGSYHGETLGALSVTDVGLYRDTYDALLVKPLLAPAPDAHGETGNEDAAATAIEALLAAHGHEIAAVIVEPLIQCAGGMRIYGPAYLQRLRAACDRHRVHLIADEIATGFGRTGTLFACEQAAISPDFMCLSKGLTGGFLPLAAVLTTDAVFAAFYAEYQSQRAFLHSHSYTGNPLACAAALATLKIFAREPVLERNRELGHWLDQAFAPLADHPHVANLRRLGTIIAFDLVAERDGAVPYPWEERRGLDLHRTALAHGVLLRPIGNVVYAMPPYVLDRAQAQAIGAAALAGVNAATAVPASRRVDRAQALDPAALEL